MRPYPKANMQQAEMAKVLPKCADTLKLSELRQIKPFFHSAQKYKATISALENSAGGPPEEVLAQLNGIKDKATAILCENGCSPEDAERFFKANLLVQRDAAIHLEYELAKVESAYGLPARHGLEKILSSEVVLAEAKRYHVAKEALLGGEHPNAQTALDIMVMANADVAAAVKKMGEKLEGPVKDVIAAIKDERLTHMSALVYSTQQQGLTFGRAA